MNDSSQAIVAARRLFPAVREATYLDLAGRAPLSSTVQAAIDEHVRDGVAGRIDKALLFDRTEQSRALFAKLVGADPDEVTFTKNTSEGLNFVATAIEWKPGDNVVICPELEHPNNVYVWLHLRRLGVAVRCIAQQDGQVPVDAMIAAIDERTRLLAVSAVTFSPGFRTNVDALGAACRARGVILLVDAAQSAGVLHTDVRASNIDVLATSTQKGLLALYGMGYLYVRREVAEGLVPASVARFGLDVGTDSAHESDMGTSDLTFLPGARRFDLGNYNYIGIHAANASLELLLYIGTREIERHACGLAKNLARGLSDLGLPVCGGRAHPRLAHIVSVGDYAPGAAAYSADGRLSELHAHLADNGVRHSMRRGLLRFAFHLYNDMTDVERVLTLAGTWKAGRR